MLVIVKFVLFRKLEVAEGVTVTPLNVFSDNRGSVMHMLRSDDSTFGQFGEIYFSSINPGYVKGWHCHSYVIQNFAVPVGNTHFVLFDDRKNSITHNQIYHYELGVDNYALLTIPPGIWYGFNAVGIKPALVANCISHPFEPSETKKKYITDPSIPFSWELFLEVKN